MKIAFVLLVVLSAGAALADSVTWGTFGGTKSVSNGCLSAADRSDSGVLQSGSNWIGGTVFASYADIYSFTAVQDGECKITSWWTDHPYGNGSVDVAILGDAYNNHWTPSNHGYDKSTMSMTVHKNCSYTIRISSLVCLNQKYSFTVSMPGATPTDGGGGTPVKNDDQQQTHGESISVDPPPVVQAVTLSSISFSVGAAYVIGGSQIPLDCWAVYSDGECQPVTPQWQIVSGSAYASASSTGILSTTVVPSTQFIRIRATYGGKSCEHEVAILSEFLVSDGELTSYVGSGSEISIPSGITSVGKYALAGNNQLISAIVPIGVTSLGDGAFSDCKNLMAISLPKSLKGIGVYAFAFCDSLQSLVLPSGLEEIDRAAFCWCKGLTDISIPAGLRKIGEEVFEGCAGLDSVYIPIGVTSVGPSAFAHCTKLRHVTILQDVTEIGKDAFFMTDLQTVFVEPGDVNRVRTMLERSGLRTANLSVTETAVPIVNALENVMSTRTEKDGVHITWDALNGVSGYRVYLQTKAPSTESVTIRKTGMVNRGLLELAFGECKLLAETSEPSFVDCAVAQGEMRKYFVAAYVQRPHAVLEGPFVQTTGLRATRFAPSAVKSAFSPSRTATLNGCLSDGGENVFGIVQVKVRKPNTRGLCKVSASVTTLDGKKHTARTQQVAIVDGCPASVSLDVKSLGKMILTIGENEFCGSLNGMVVLSTTVGGNLSKLVEAVHLGDADMKAIPGRVQSQLLPMAESIIHKNGLWSFAKAANVKWGMMKGDAEKHLVVNTGKGRTNLSGLRLKYAPKTGLFKGSFKLYSLEGDLKNTRLKKYSVKVSGVVVDGTGFGEASLKRPACVWPVTVY